MDAVGFSGLKVPGSNQRSVYLVWTQLHDVGRAIQIAQKYENHNMPIVS